MRLPTPFFTPRSTWQFEEGYFADEGIDLTLMTGFGADKVLTAMISGEADIGFMGAEATVYAYLEGTADPVVNFAQLTQRAGNFVVGREKDNSFTWEKLKNKEVLGGRKGGMPEWSLSMFWRRKGLIKKRRKYQPEHRFWFHSCRVLRRAGGLYD